jgi:hypothetical protein
MKSIYIDEELHGQLRFLAALAQKPLKNLVENYLKRAVEKKLSDLPAQDLQKLATAGGSLDFLKKKQEDIYSDGDGQAI